MRQRQQRRRRALLISSAAVGLIAVIAGGAYVYQSSFLTVENVLVEGTSRLTRDDVLSDASIPAGATLLRLRPGRVEGRLEANPWISDASVHRELPDTVHITVSERGVAAVVNHGGEAWLVSGDGTFLQTRSEEDTTSYVVVEEVGGLSPSAGSASGSTELTNALAALAGLSDELRQQVETVSAPTIDKTALRTKDGVEIFVGEAQDMGVKDQVARKILEEEQGKVVYINVRTADRATWRGLEE